MMSEGVLGLRYKDVMMFVKVIMILYVDLLGAVAAAFDGSLIFSAFADFMNRQFPTPCLGF